ncbi:BLUF domain-containing protein [Leucothrix pacifica]|uniref:Phosphonate transporter n=1 Tax=Leucothrix pacifica TaxID=1247513 RepID=A0A317C0W9_9GAMM|nr:BLUF domain-containing protein [Leucothrix pacifica]PWQ92306.1 phosphonate transporter [Leucothrix pacifica]
MTNLTRVIYASRAARYFSSNDILELLSRARHNNSSLNVTGMLLYDHGSFFQVIEGSESVINALFDKISKDKRHTQVTKISTESITKRQFGEWSMGYASVSADEIKDAAGMNDFFEGTDYLSKIDEGRAKTLLKAFADGRWKLD